MNSDKYEAFLLAADYGSLTAAAEELGYTQSGITRMIQSLEAEAGFRLFVRAKKGVQLTENGRRLMPYFREISRNMQIITQISTDISGVAQGSISIGSCYSIAAGWLPGLIKGFQSLYPGISINLRENGNEALLRYLSDRSVDLCFCMEPEMKELDWIPLFQDELVAWVPAAHPAAEKGYLAIADLEKEAFIHTQPDQDTEIDRFFKQSGITPDVRFTTLNAYTTYNMVAAGLGISLDQSLRSRNWAGNVVQLPLKPRRFESFGIAVPSLGSASPATRSFIQYVRESMSSYPLFSKPAEDNIKK